MVNDIKDFLEKELKKQLLSGRVMLDRFRVIDEESRKSSVYNCTKYVQPYYHLSKLIQPKSMVEFGFKLGFFSASFLKGCKTVSNLFLYQEQMQGFSQKLGIANVRDNYKNIIFCHVGSIFDDRFLVNFKKNKFDLAIINEELSYDKHRDYLDVIWDQLNSDGLIAMDYINRQKACKEAYFDFCKSKNRPETVVDSRYGIGLIMR